MNGVGISHALKVDEQLRELVLEAFKHLKVSQYAGFYYNNVAEEWDYWVSETADNTASNVYYDSNELGNFIREYFGVVFA